MPIYEYQCRACSQVIDALQKFDDAPLKKCPSCGKPRLERLLSAPMFLLKGSGWYETDFKGDKERRKNLADRPEPEAKGSDTKADAQAEGKAGASDTKADASDAKADAGSGDKKAEKQDSAVAAPRTAAGKSRSSTTRRGGARRKPVAKPKARRR